MQLHLPQNLMVVPAAVFSRFDLAVALLHVLGLGKAKGSNYGA